MKKRQKRRLGVVVALVGASMSSTALLLKAFSFDPIAGFALLGFLLVCSGGLIWTIAENE